MEDILAQISSPVSVEGLDIENLAPRLQMLVRHKESAYNWQQRRHDEWTENYMLYRDKVILNRLTQRQSINLPIIKTSVKTALKDIDDAPLLYFTELDNDKDKEIIYNEYFSFVAEDNKLTIKDIVDKKQVLLYGRSFKKLNIVNGKFHFEVLDPQDVLVDRFVDPSNIDSARYICHQHIFVPLSSLAENEDYDQEAVKKLQSYMATRAGLLEADANLQTLQDRNKRMEEMGVPDMTNPILGETYIELNEHYIKQYDKDLNDDVFNLVVTGESREILFDGSLEEYIGKTKSNYWRHHTPLVTWADDVERTDIWSDGMADTLRGINKIANSWISQLIENRTLINFGMNFYDAKADEEFTPQTYEPGPFKWIPLPGKPGDIFQHVDIQPLEDSIQDIQFVMGIAEQASAATSISQGVPEPQQITLGEVQILMQNAQERIKSLSVFYTDAWKEFGEKYVKLLEAADYMIDGVTLYKKGVYNDNMYPRDIQPEDWRSKEGYTCKVVSRSEKEAEDTNALQKLNAVKAAMPDNQPLLEIYNKKLLEFADLSPQEVKQVLDFELQKQNAPALMAGQAQNTPLLPSGQPNMPAPNMPMVRTGGVQPTTPLIG